MNCSNRSHASGTNIPLALQYVTNAIKRSCTAFVISDFIDAHPSIDALSIANRKHDIVAIRVFDAFEKRCPMLDSFKCMM